MPNKSIGYYETLLQSKDSFCTRDSYINMCLVGFPIASDGYIDNFSYRLVFLFVLYWSDETNFKVILSYLLVISFIITRITKYEKYFFKIKVILELHIKNVW